MIQNSTEAYGGLSKLLHWVMALVIIGLLASGIWMEGLADKDPIRFTVYGLHKSFGVLALSLGVIRVAWILWSRPPALPGVLQRWEVLASKGAAGALYVLMLAVPFSGWAMSNLKGYPVKFFDLFTLPALAGKDEVLAEIPHTAHWVLGYLMIAVLVAHVAGAIKHRYMDKDPEADVLARMLPGGS